MLSNPDSIRGATPDTIGDTNDNTIRVTTLDTIGVTMPDTIGVEHRIKTILARQFSIVVRECFYSYVIMPLLSCILSDKEDCIC